MRKGFLEGGYVWDGSLLFSAREGRREGRGGRAFQSKARLLKGQPHEVETRISVCKRKAKVSLGNEYQSSKDSRFQDPEPLTSPSSGDLLLQTPLRFLAILVKSGGKREKSKALMGDALLLWLPKFTRFQIKSTAGSKWILCPQLCGSRE